MPIPLPLFAPIYFLVGYAYGREMIASRWFVLVVALGLGLGATLDPGLFPNWEIAVVLEWGVACVGYLYGRHLTISYRKEKERILR